MYNDEELSKFLLDLESDLVERKESGQERDKIRQMICALSNDLPGHNKAGVIFVGARNDGSCANLPIIDRLIQQISNIRSEGNILPIPNMLLEKRTINNCEMIVIFVTPSDSPPVRLKGAAWIRVGSTLRIATPDEERRLSERRRFRDLPFDRRPVDGANLSDVDLDFFQRTYLPVAISPDLLEKNQRNREQQMIALRLLSVDHIPTYGAILTMGKSPLDFVAGAYLQFVRVDGLKLTDPIKDEKRLTGPLFELLPKLDELLEINISTAVDVTSGPREIKQPDYPIIALQQLTRNALMHRNYETSNAPVRINWFSDRIEISNPGGLYGQVNESNFGRPGITDYRNPLIAEIMKVMGYVQTFGMGIPLAKSELAKNNNPPPNFFFDSSNFLVTVRRPQ
jgi:ATP-dependent DNA helicase RecG